MASEAPVTAVEAARWQHRWRRRVLLLLACVILLLGLGTAWIGVAALRMIARDSTPEHGNVVAHFQYGSIGAEVNGLPYWIWQALPRLFPAEFGGRRDYAAFGFLYENEAAGPRDLPIGISRRMTNGVELVWFNCAICHVGTWRAAENGPRHIVPGMPSNNFDLYRFIRFLLDAAADERLAAEHLFAAMEAEGARFGWIERLVWRFYVIPQVREGLIMRRTRLLPLLADQPAWGPGRVDTFNPYKLVQFAMPVATLAASERIGTADFPAIFNQRPRQGMQLHWDGNNPSLDERNLSAAIGAGVTPETADHTAIERVAEWLLDLPAPTSPHRPDPTAAERGRVVYMEACASCHGYRDTTGYVFRGGRLGRVEPNAQLGVDSARLESYTEAFRQRQLAELFAGTRYQFRSFVRTDGYANLPLDGLWLRGPYLHNGAVPTLAALLLPPEQRPRAFLRGSDVIDGVNGGFVSPECDPARPAPHGLCFDTSRPGNGNGGHRYGTDLAQGARADLLAYLLTF
jgi:mono/diheme cytochrome c family protein